MASLDIALLTRPGEARKRIPPLTSTTTIGHDQSSLVHIDDGRRAHLPQICCHHQAHALATSTTCLVEHRLQACAPSFVSFAHYVLYTVSGPTSMVRLNVPRSAAACRLRPTCRTHGRTFSVLELVKPLAPWCGVRTLSRGTALIGWFCSFHRRPHPGCLGSEPVRLRCPARPPPPPLPHR